MSNSQPTDTKKKTLIVEDDVYLSDVYRTKFEKEGYEVKVSSDGESGVKTAIEWRPDIILLDIMLPKMDGFDVLEELKNHAETKSIPVIMWTNKSDSTEAERAKKMGATEYLVKVYHTPTEIVDKIKNHL